MELLTRLLVCFVLISLFSCQAPMERDLVQDRISKSKELNNRDWQSSLALVSFVENDIALLMNQGNLWDKLIDNEIRSLVLPIGFEASYSKDKLSAFFKTAAQKKIKLFLQFDCEKIGNDKRGFVEGIKELTTIHDVAGIIFSQIESVKSTFWIEIAPVIKPNKELLMIANGEIHPSSLNTFFDLNINSRLVEYFATAYTAKDLDSKRIIKSLEAFKEEMPKKAIAMNATASPFWGTWKKFEYEDFITVLAFTIDGVVYINAETGGLGLSDVSEIYEDLLRLKAVNSALDIEAAGLEWLDCKNESVMAFKKVNGDERIIVLANGSKSIQKIVLEAKGLEGAYSNIFDRSSINIQEELTIELEPLEYILLSNRF